MNRDYLIYCFLDENEKPYYIGQTYNLKNRLNVHNSFIMDVEEIKKPSKYLYYRKTRELLAAGKNLNVQVLEEGLTKEAVDQKEKELILQYRQDPTCRLLNVLDGGDSDQRGKKVSQETKDKISAAKKDKPLSEKHRKALTGIKHKPATFTPEGIKHRNECLRKANLNRVMSNETKDKIRKAKMGIKHSDESNKKKGRSGKENHWASLYRLISPEGVIFIVSTFKEAEETSGIKYQTLRWALKIKQNNQGETHGWKIENVQD